jgi:hypothetical protein
MTRGVAALLATLMASAAMAQPAQPPPPFSEPVEKALAAAPFITLTNGRITAKVTPPDLERGFFRGTRFDQAGVVTSLKLGGKEFYGPWFSRTAPEVLDYTYTADGLVAGPDSAATGPVEEFAQLGFDDAKPGGTFVKIGVGVLRRPDDRPYDKYWHYEIADWGQRGLRHTTNSVTFTQRVANGPSGYAYDYEKTLRLVPGTTQLVIEHALKNTGAKTISSNVYNHNFLRLTPGNDGIRVTFPFKVTAANPPAADLLRIGGNSMTYLRPMAYKERISFAVTGFGATASDYDISITDPKTKAGVRMQGDQPITRINIFSIDTTQSVEPYIGIELAPGAEKRWRYTYTFTAPQ